MIRNIYILTLFLSLSFGTVTDFDGNVYETVLIGEQLWMAENLKVTHYRNGDEIPTGYSNEEWDNLSSGSYAVYPADNDSHSTAACGGDCAAIFGNLYNWFAVDDDRGVCPEGWDIPTDDEYKILEMNVGMSESEANGTGWRGSNEGSKLAGHADLWRDGDLKSDSEFGISGFNALAAGFRQMGTGDYLALRSNGYFWTSSEYNSEMIWIRLLRFFEPDVGRNGSDESYGFSIRCVADDITTGCTDPDASNYNPDATVDDGSCSSCDEGFMEIDGNCYYQSDLDILQAFIDNSQAGDNPPPSDLSPIELGEQEWEDGRLIEFVCTTYYPTYLDYELSGGIPSEIENLENLTYLKIVGNQLDGEIPPEIGNLSNLNYLYLGLNSLSGEIPSEIGDLNNLNVLNLHSNDLVGEIPVEITNLINLHTLLLYSNDLTGEIPPEIGNLESLWNLDLRNNNLTGEIPPEIGNLDLVGLWLFENQLSGEIPPEIGNLTNLITLWLYDNQLSGEIPLEIGNLTSLTSLRLNNNNLSGLIPDSICDLEEELVWSSEELSPGSENSYISYIYNNQLCPPYPGCMEEFVGEQDTAECLDGCDDKVTIANQWADGFHYDFTYTLGELTDYEGEPIQQIVQKEIISLRVICQETGEVWSFDSSEISGGNGNHDFSFLQKKYEDFPLPTRDLTNGVLLGIDTYAAGNYHSLWFSVTAIDDEGNEFIHDNYVDTNPYGWYSANEITFPGLNFTGLVNYANLAVLYAEGAFPVADITYQIEGNGYYEAFVCDETCEGSLSTNNCEDSIELSLHEGSNLMSFSILPEDNSVENILSGDNILAIAGEGEAAMNTDVGWVGSLTTVLHENGYWLRLNEAGTLNLTGIHVQPGQLYFLHAGNNLISYPLSDCGSINEVLPDDMEDCIYAIAGEGVATLNTDNGWVGSLTALCPNEGYWFVNQCDDIEFTFDEPASLARTVSLSKPPYPYNQSSQQAFYFIEFVENIKLGDWILAYNGKTIIGARQWQGNIIDVPAMGYDGSDYTLGYMEAGTTPEFKVLRDSKLIDLEGYVPVWYDNSCFIVSSLTEAIDLPETFSLDRAYPNPFNPTTTLSFALPADSKVLLKVYDINGRIIRKLVDNYMEAGYHSVIWNADSHSSGLYIIKMQARGFTHTQKLMLVK